MSDHVVRTYVREAIRYDSHHDFIGEGEFGEVFRARLDVDERLVAVKVLRTPQRLKDTQISSLMKEASILQELGDHPNVVRLLGVCIHPKHYAVVLEYCTCNLDALIVRELDKFPRVREWACRVAMTRDVARGMSYLHGRAPPVIHRDLKSSNVLVNCVGVANGETYQCKISDFGFAKMRGISSQTTRRSTPGNRPIGTRSCSTLPFIAPERFQGDGVTTKVDVYGFAVILWQLKELKRPYEEADKQIVLCEKVLAGERLPLSSDDRAPYPLSELIEECWRMKPEERPTFEGKLTFIKIVSRLKSAGHCDEKPFSDHGVPVTSPADPSSSSSFRQTRTGESLNPFLTMFPSQHPQPLSLAPPMVSMDKPPEIGTQRSAMQLFSTPAPAPAPALSQSHPPYIETRIDAGVTAAPFTVRDAANTIPPHNHPSPYNPPAHIMAIKHQWKNLVESLDASALVDTLYSECTQMSLDQMEAIMSSQTRLEKAKKLLYFLQNQDASVYNVFLRALRKTQSFLYDLLVHSPVSASHVSPDRPVGYDPVFQSFDRSAIANAATSGIASGGYQLSRDEMIAKLGPHEEMSERTSTGVLDYISVHLGSNWKRVGRHLGLKEPDIQNILADYQNDQQEQGYQMLLRWCRLAGVKKTRSVLLDALLRVNQHIINEL